MDDKIETKIIGKPSVESLSEGEFDALCTALFFEIEKIISTEGKDT